MSSDGKVALVTGAGTGIGRAAALALLGDGYRVGLVGRRSEPLEGTAAASEAGSRALVIPADITDPDAVRAVFATVETTWGRLDVLFNNAGMATPPIPIEDHPPRAVESRRRRQPDCDVRVHAGGDQDHEEAGSSRRPDHQQRLDLGAYTSAGLGALHRNEARGDRPHEVHRTRRQEVSTSPVARSTSATPRPSSARQW